MREPDEASLRAIKNKIIHLGKQTIFTSSHGNRYQIVRLVGTGKNSVVFYVLCTAGEGRGRFFSLKIQFNKDDRRLQRFYREATFLKQQQHPLIVRYTDDGHYIHSDGERFPFIVLSYIPYTLADYLAKPTFSFEKKMCFACQLLSLLQWLKNVRIVHRDIKPQNIFTDGHAIVMGDWGLHKNLNTESVLLENLIDNRHIFNGTHTLLPQSYRTPELVAYANRRDVMRLESDVFQLGLVLAEMFTAVNPLMPNTDDLAPIQLNPLPAIQGIYGGHIRHLLNGMLALDYTKRFSVDYLLDAFVPIYQAISGCLGQSPTGCGEE